MEDGGKLNSFYLTGWNAFLGVLPIGKTPQKALSLDIKKKSEAWALLEP